MSKRTEKTISKVRTRQSGHTTEISEVILRFWEGLEVVDANFDLVVHLTDVDYEHAKARDMFECAFIQSVRRLYDSKHAVFARTMAYVDLVMDGDKRKVYRFTLSTQAIRIIKSFDKTKTDEERAALAAKAGTNFILRAPSISKTFDMKSKVERRRRLLIKGTATCESASETRRDRKAREEKNAKQREYMARKKKVERSFLQLSDVRNASGLIKFQVGKIHSPK